ncbi:hypothetical protein ACFZAV_13180 [Streptomyces sp. NPDC008343]|uniref:hypothetical protein n=1 Tax=Streptomyces sp. NPDC008343 TaxID=3364828 RepID=UPI0036E359F8
MAAPGTDEVRPADHDDQATVAPLPKHVGTDHKAIGLVNGSDDLRQSLELLRRSLTQFVANREPGYV